MRRMRRNGHIALRGSWTGVNSSCDLSRRGVSMNIHPQTVTCQQGPENHFGYNPALSFTLNDSSASALLSGCKDKRQPRLSAAHLFMCTCPVTRRKVQNFLLRAAIWPICIKPGERTHTCSDLPDYLRQFNHWSQAEWDLKVLCNFRHWFHFISPWKRKLLELLSYLVLNLSFQPATAPARRRTCSLQSKTGVRVLNFCTALTSQNLNAVRSLREM